MPSITCVIKAHKQNADAAVSVTLANFLAATATIEGNKRKIMLEGVDDEDNDGIFPFDLRTLVIDPSGGGIRVRIAPIGGGASKALQVIDTDSFLASLAAIKKARASIFINNVRYDLRTFVPTYVP